MKDKRIQLTEQDLHVLVEDAVMQYLVNEGFLSNMWGGMKNVAGGVGDKMKQGYNTMGAMYYQGAANSQIQQLQTTLQKYQQKLAQIQQQYQQKMQQIQHQIESLQGKADNKRLAAAQNQANFSNRMDRQSYQMPNNTVNMQPQQGQQYMSAANSVQ